MREFDFLNTFFNIVYQNESAYMRDFVSSYEYIQGFSQWLKSHSIDFPSLANITLADFSLFSARMKAIDIDRIIHVDFHQDVINLSQIYRCQTHMIYIPGFHQEVLPDTHKINDLNVSFYVIHEKFSQEDLSFFDPFPAFFKAMNHADLWPGVLIFNQEEQVFTAIHNQSDFDNLISHIEKNDDLFEVYNDYQQDSYFLQLSDLHLGKNKRLKGLEQLYNSLDYVVPQMHSNEQLKVLITGDLMETPNRKNMYLANDFMNSLKRRYKANVTFILGNHDVIVHGFNMRKNQKSKVIAYLLGESIKVLEQEKVILIKLDTTSEGNLARGMVGQRQLDEIDDELEAIDHLEEYTLIVLLHHHVYPISKAEFIKTKWHEKTFINRIVETSKVLVDAPLLIKWLEERKIKYVFHGHKHLPFFNKVNDQYYIGGGSSTGGLKESRSRYISYTIVKYNTYEKQMKTCLIFYDDKAKAERQRVEVYLFEEENNENS